MFLPYIFENLSFFSSSQFGKARIVPPTAQNQAFMEDDMRGYAGSVLDLPEPEAAARLEALIRCYDPCISCATHFLRLEVERI